MLHILLRVEGASINRKRTYRLYIELGMQVCTKRGKKLVRPRITMAVATRPNERWSLDFATDQLACGRRIRTLNIMDDFSRVCVGTLVDFSISGACMARFLDQRKEIRRPPRMLVMDNGPEMTCKAMLFPSQQTQAKPHFTQPAKPNRNAFVESFNGKLRDGCLNHHWFLDPAAPRRIIDNWREHYNTTRPHSSLGYSPPAVLESKVACYRGTTLP